MRKLGSNPTQNWDRQDSPVKVAGMPGAAYAQTVKQGDWISIHDEHGTQIDVIRGIATDWLSKTNAVALAGYSIGTNNWTPNGNQGTDYAFYRAQIAGDSVLASKTADSDLEGKAQWLAQYQNNLAMGLSYGQIDQDKAQRFRTELIDGGWTIGHGGIPSKTSAVSWSDTGDWTNRSHGEHGGLSLSIAEPRPGQFEITISADENNVLSEGFSGDLEGAKAHADVILRELQEYGDF